MKKNGFTLIELLICLALLGFVLVIGVCASREKLATSLVSFRAVSDHEVFEAAKSYVSENNIEYNEKSYVCVSVSELIDYGYLADMNDQVIKRKIVKLKRSKMAKVISNIKYVDNCN